MADSIREQIFLALETRLADIRTANQYHTEMGAEVLRSFRPAVSQTKLPCVGFHVDIEEKVMHYGPLETRLLPIGVQGIAAFDAVSPPVMGERIFADIEECVLGSEYTLDFDSGGTSEIEAADRITGEDSGAQALVISLTVSSGTWGAGNAAGTFTLRRLVGIYQDNEELSVGVQTGLATVKGSITQQTPESLAGGGIADQIRYLSGKTVMEEADGETVGAIIVFQFQYKVVAGNPYSQTA